MPPNESTSARLARNQHALGGTITGMGRRHNGVHHRLARVNGFGLHRDSRHPELTAKDGTCLPCGKDIDSLELAQLVIEYVICKCSVPDNIVTYCGTQFTSWFWTQVCSHFSTDYRLSTAFHTQTDGQTGRHNQTDGALSPGFLQLRAGQLVRTLAASQIRLQ